VFDDDAGAAAPDTLVPGALEPVVVGGVLWQAAIDSDRHAIQPDMKGFMWHLLR
jgi:hypothetical protein